MIKRLSDDTRKALLPPALVILGGVLAYTGFGEARTARAMAEHGKAAVAEITAIRSKETSFSGKDQAYKADIRFQTENGQSASVTVVIPVGLGSNIRADGKGGSVPIRYLPENPSKIALGEPPDNSILSFILAFVMILAGAGLFALDRWRNPAA